MSIHEWAGTREGTFAIVGPPLSGKLAFIGEIIDTSDGDTLFVTTTRGADRRPSDPDVIIDATPGPATGVADVTVSSPADLTGISMPVSTFLDSADEPVMCLDSVTSLLLYAEEAAVFRFLSVLSAHIRRVDGLGLYSIVPDCHDEQTLRTFAQVFDGHVTIDETGDRARAVGPQAPADWHPL